MGTYVLRNRGQAEGLASALNLAADQRGSKDQFAAAMFDMTRGRWCVRHYIHIRGITYRREYLMVEGDHAVGIHWLPDTETCAHVWVTEEVEHGEGRSYCELCGADGDG